MQQCCNLVVEYTSRIEEYDIDIDFDVNIEPISTLVEQCCQVDLPNQTNPMRPGGLLLALAIDH